MKLVGSVGVFGAILFSGQAFAAAAVPMGDIGTFNGGSWFFDLDRSHSWTNGDEVHHLGSPGDTPVVYSHTTFCAGSDKTAVIGSVRSASTWFLSQNDLDWDAADATNTFIFGPEPFAPRPGPALQSHSRTGYFLSTGTSIELGTPETSRCPLV